MEISRPVDEMCVNNHSPPFLSEGIYPRSRFCWTSNAEYGRSTARHENMFKAQALRGERKKTNVQQGPM